MELNLKIGLKRGEGFEQSKMSHWFGSWKGIDVTGSPLQLSWAKKFCSELWKCGGAVVSKWRSGEGNGLLPVLPMRLPAPRPCKPDASSQGGIECSAVSFIFTVFFSGRNLSPTAVLLTRSDHGIGWLNASSKITSGTCGEPDTSLDLFCHRLARNQETSVLTHIWSKNLQPL